LQALEDTGLHPLVIAQTLDVLDQERSGKINYNQFKRLKEVNYNSVEKALLGTVMTGQN
tara:strand:+ start:94 stop:270 length:177 start_codon:yes stop_codon:yes gene_type:complete